MFQSLVCFFVFVFIIISVPPTLKWRSSKQSYPYLNYYYIIRLLLLNTILFFLYTFGTPRGYRKKYPDETVAISFIKFSYKVMLE